MGILLQDVYKDCYRAKKAFEKEIEEFKLKSVFPYPKMNLGYLYLLMGKEKASRQFLKKALVVSDPHLSSTQEYGYALSIAVKLGDDEKINKYFQQENIEMDYSCVCSLLSYALIYDQENIERCKKQAWATMDSYDRHFAMLKELYYLSGMRHEARNIASNLVSELLSFPESLISGFKDKPKPDSWYDRYRPFANHLSRGAGDPGDRHLFCMEKTGTELFDPVIRVAFK